MWTDCVPYSTGGPTTKIPGEQSAVRPTSTAGLWPYVQQPLTRVIASYSLLVDCPVNHPDAYCDSDRPQIHLCMRAVYKWYYREPRLDGI
ncbi:unnamed protein product [Acanthoscelides obtectus]|uniref:Uncharacterized protein n=1 Tax=Acanthoscelides obtectus TaxID=200917 RepID=A0A9P0LQI3_ACAOB|nr:unnamed protein product [Acanthoscelides obtectus]CAK1654819.1 hypothetical protein AOBTE_LOCUS18869 [Acanthoscelides obtectus]